MAHPSRRKFLEDSMLASVAAMGSMAVRPVFGADSIQPSSPNEKLGVAVVGVRHRGGAHIAAFNARQDTEILWIVDVDRAIGEAKVAEIAQQQGRKPKFTQDMREAFADPSLDIVSIATPNHWHALASIWAMQHGKDVYLEKPVSHNVAEGRRIVEAARKYNRICQTGTQSRSMSGVRSAMKFLHDGKLGTVSLARGMCYKARPSIGPPGTHSPPPTVNYDIWQGPAAEAPVARSQFHYDWHWQWPYGNGDLGNQGIHQMDVARWGLGATELSKSVLSFGGRFGYEDAGETPNTQVVVHDFGDKTLIFEVRGLATAPYKGAPIGVVFEATDGYMVIAAYDAAVFDKQGKMADKFSGGGEAAHYDNFITAVRSRNSADLNADILEGHISSALCHLGNTSYRLGERVQVAEARRHLGSQKNADVLVETLDRTCSHLQENSVDLEQAQLQLGAQLAFDASAEEYVGNDAANAQLTREYRAPFTVPSAEQL